MSIYIYNSLTRKKEEFKPIKADSAKMYVCGPTVYDEPHIGHARGAFIFDVIRHYFKYKGFLVKYVRNVTDVDDKIIDKARKEFPDMDLINAVKKISTKYLDAYHDDKERGNIVLKLSPKLSPVKVGVFSLVNKLNDETKHLKDVFYAKYDGSIESNRYGEESYKGVEINTHPFKLQCKKS